MGPAYENLTALMAELQLILDEQDEAIKLTRLKMNGIPATHPSQATQGQDAAVAGSQQQGQQPPANNPTIINGGNWKSQPMTVWKGSLKWSAATATGKKEVMVHVAANTGHQGSFAETWPKCMTLGPVLEHPIKMADLQAWIRQYKPILCTFTTNSQGLPEPQPNEANYRMLVQLLAVKRVYATAAWNLPSGELRNNVLLFAVNTVELVGAFFPVTGIPAMPKPLSILAGPLPLDLTTQVQALDPDQREFIFAQLRQRREYYLQQTRLITDALGESDANTSAETNDTKNNH